MGEITTATRNSVAPQQWPNSVTLHGDLLSKKQWMTSGKMGWERPPNSLSQPLRDYLQSVHDDLLGGHVLIKPAECAAIIMDVLPFFWDKQIDVEAMARQAAIWHQTLKDHSMATVQSVALEWVKTSRRAPTPADFYELCNLEDETPDRLKRLGMLLEIPVRRETDIGMAKPEEQAMLGCAFKLGEMIRHATKNGIEFSAKEKDAYLIHGVIPAWWQEHVAAQPVEKVEEAPTIPTRDEILDTMPPEARLAATRSR